MRWPVIGWLLKKAGIFGVKRGKADVAALKEALDHIRRGFDDGEEYNDIVSALIDGGPGKTDHFMVCRDYESYGLAQERVDQMYRRPENWNYMSLVNIANSGRFAADRSVAEYAQNIWRVHTSFAY